MGARLTPYDRWKATWPERLAKAQAERDAKPKNRPDPIKRAHDGGYTAYWHAERVADVRRLAGMGYTRAQIATALKIKRSTLDNACTRYSILTENPWAIGGVERRGTNRPYDMDEAKRLYADAVSIRDIASRFQISAYRLRREMEAAGVAIRTNREAALLRPLSFKKNEGLSQ
jgi:hypothetical protein